MESKSGRYGEIAAIDGYIRSRGGCVYIFSPFVRDRKIRFVSRCCDSTAAKGSGVGSLGPLGGMVRRYSFRTCTLGSLLCL